MKTLISVLGATATGKTDYAIKLAQKYNTEIISCDSRQFYKEMAIGTAAPSKSELKKAKHHLIGNISIHDYYNVSKFENDAIKIINKLFETKDFVVMVGGSGLYANAVHYGIDNLPDPSPEIREELNTLYKEQGLIAIQKKLEELDPDYYKKVDLQNAARIIRALEVCITANKPYSKLLSGKKKERDFTIEKKLLSIERSELIQRINKRVDIMVEMGLVDEVKGLYKFRELNALKTVGYQEIFKYLDGDDSLETAIEQIKIHTRQFARRQVTWFKKY